VGNLLTSLRQQREADSTSQPPENLFTTLSDLLSPETGVPVIAAAPTELLDALLMQLPGAALLPELSASASASASEVVSDAASGTASGAASEAAAIASLSDEQKRRVITRVLRSPQFLQSLGVLTLALRDGGLPTVAGALGVRVENGGYVPGSTVPLGGGDAVEAFVKGVEKAVEDEERKEKDGSVENMDTS
jgi:26S proteasome regulatory subunit N13